MDTQKFTGANFAKLQIIWNMTASHRTSAEVTHKECTNRELKL